MSRTSSSEEQANVTFMAFGTVADGQLLSSWAHPDLNNKEGTEETFSKILHAAKVRLAPGQRQRLMWDNSTVSIMLNSPEGDLMFGIVTSSADYPERLAYQCLGELETYHGEHGLEDIQQEMARLSGKYQDPAEFDKLAKLQEKTNALKGVMKDNIKGIVKNNQRLSILQEDAQDMQLGAQEYNEKSKEIKDYFWWKDCKVVAIACVVMALVVGFFLYWIYSMIFGKRDSGGAAVPARLLSPSDSTIILSNHGNHVTDPNSHGNSASHITDGTLTGDLIWM